MTHLHITRPTSNVDDHTVPHIESLPRLLSLCVGVPKTVPFYSIIIIINKYKYRERI